MRCGADFGADRSVSRSSTKIRGYRTYFARSSRAARVISLRKSVCASPSESSLSDYYFSTVIMLEPFSSTQIVTFTCGRCAYRIILLLVCGLGTLWLPARDDFVKAVTMGSKCSSWRICNYHDPRRPVYRIDSSTTSLVLTRFQKAILLVV